MKELFYHELTHCPQYEKLGNSWYTTFVNSELIEVISNVGTIYSPYGDGSNSQSALVAFGEGWAYPRFGARRRLKKREKDSFAM